MLKDIDSISACTEPHRQTILRIGLGGGCHWCTEAVFLSLRGVTSVKQGFIRSTSPNCSFSEAVIVQFDNAEISQEVLIEVHLRTHASTVQHSMRGKYRSAVYTFDEHQAQSCQQTLTDLQPGFAAPIVTQILRYEQFKSSDSKYHNYYYKNPEKAFCTTYIDPKLALLHQRYRKYLLDTENAGA